ncbi:hypothetical protein H310_13855 [Aphanomyces invadans]|uniref:Peptidase C1A papain C-terminal domain-containing protein n=1 Tax=Aphanomyces invadans TaxID=157072 RepID=A0A024TBR0_9STRA|nr:hypothetical protein H310_13855 [Aphanomyces invadans]ETV91605.1 hypothetical protein H310_13855 [Aphanomyces invadans]|eukprot:XP_008879724.1 hypothetical protein H310_13855 [Aphanomyces invadans]
MKLFAAVVVASVATTKQSVTTLSSDERRTLRAELAKWRKEFGAKAAARGLMPRVAKSMSPLEAETDALQRFYNNKLAIEEARRNNPRATFDHDHPFALLTKDEFKQLVVGRSFEQGLSAAQSAPSVKVVRPRVEESMDWTTTECVNPIRYQGYCGSCWAFSAVGTAESAHCIMTGELLDLSEQQVVSCSTNGYSMGCSGGFEDAALDYITSEGLCLEHEYPYTSGEANDTGECYDSCTKVKLEVEPTVRVNGEEDTIMALSYQPATTSG